MIRAHPSPSPLRIGTRGSPLAMVQARAAVRRLRALDPGAAIEITEVRTTGDRVLDRPLAEIGGKGLFTRELDDALLDGRIDAAAHSMKDVPSELPPGIALVALMVRADPRDALIGTGIHGIDDLPHGARVGTSSPRRAALLRLRRPDVSTPSLRGNVGTRLAKLRRGEVDAILLAMAGLRRLRLSDVDAAPLDPSEMLPAAGQGVVGVVCRADDERTAARLAALDDHEARVTVSAERGLLAALGGSCYTPVAARAAIEGAEVSLSAIVAAPDGSESHRIDRRGPVDEARAIGEAAGHDLLLALSAGLRARLRLGE